MNGMSTDVYKIKNFEYPGITVRAHIPVLNEDERAKRMEQIHKQAAKLLKKAK